MVLIAERNDVRQSSIVAFGINDANLILFWMSRSTMPAVTVDLPVPEGPAIRILWPYGDTVAVVPSARRPMGKRCFLILPRK